MFDLQIHFTFKIQFCTCETLIPELYAFPGLARMENKSTPAVEGDIIDLCFVFFLGALFYSQINSHSYITLCDG